MAWNLKGEDPTTVACAALDLLKDVVDDDDSHISSTFRNAVIIFLDKYEEEPMWWSEFAVESREGGVAEPNYMTVQQLLNKLQKVENKKLKVVMELPGKGWTAGEVRSVMENIEYKDHFGNAWGWFTFTKLTRFVRENWGWTKKDIEDNRIEGGEEVVLLEL